MPQLDLETFLCGGDLKVACETMIDGEFPAEKEPVEDPDMPSESFQVRIGEEIDWIDVNAVYERDDSTKGNTNPKSQHANYKQQQQQQQPSNSQRFSGNLKSKAPIYALPNKIQHSGNLGVNVRRLPTGQMFPKKKRAGDDRKSAVPLAEPGSPKVSCFGKVLSDRERKRSKHRQPGSAPSTGHVHELNRRPSGGCLAMMMRMFRCGRMPTRQYEEDVQASTRQEKTVPCSGRFSAAEEMDASAVVTPAGLGEMKRFSSVRRPASFGGDEDSDGDMRVAYSAPLDRNGE